MAVTVSPKEPAITNWNQSRFTSNSVVENEDYWQMLSRGEGSAYRRLVIMVLSTSCCA
jgi:hypothetical protein